MSSKVSNVMRVVQEAVKEMESWSPARRDYAERASQYNWGSNRGLEDSQIARPNNSFDD